MFFSGIVLRDVYILVCIYCILKNKKHFITRLLTGGSHICWSEVSGVKFKVHEVNSLYVHVLRFSLVFLC